MMHPRDEALSITRKLLASLLSKENISPASDVPTTGNEGAVKSALKSAVVALSRHPALADQHRAVHAGADLGLRALDMASKRGWDYLARIEGELTAHKGKRGLKPLIEFLEELKPDNGVGTRTRRTYSHHNVYPQST